jgi:NADH-quinone oxidoreductase subunit E
MTKVDGAPAPSNRPTDAGSPRASDALRQRTTDAGSPRASDALRQRTPTAGAGLGVPATPVAFSGEQLAEVRRLQSLYPDPRGALLPVLHLAQEAFGHVSLEVEEYVAGLFGLSPARLHEVVTFYTLYFQAPPGRHVVSVCHNLSCHLAGASRILDHLRARLGVDVGETTDDGRVTLLSVECLCACEHAPMMQVDDRYEFDLTPEKVDRLLEGLS